MCNYSFHLPRLKYNLPKWQTKVWLENKCTQSKLPFLTEQCFKLSVTHPGLPTPDEGKSRDSTFSRRRTNGLFFLHSELITITSTCCTNCMSLQRNSIWSPDPVKWQNKHKSHGTVKIILKWNGKQVQCSSLIPDHLMAIALLMKGWVQNHAKWRSQVFFFFFLQKCLKFCMSFSIE